MRFSWPRQDGNPPGPLRPHDKSADLYKWAYKLLPAVSSELLLDCFDLAWRIRELDMRASPYDLQEWGYEPVRIETPSGRAAYAKAQKGFAQEANDLRQRLLSTLDRVDALATSALP